MNSYPPSIGGPQGDQGYTNNNAVQQDPWRHYSQSQSHYAQPMPQNEYNRGQRDNYTQSAVPDNAFSNPQANAVNNNARKRAAKRRVKHDLPGPAGSWFRKNSKRPPKKAKALLLSTKKGIIKSEEQDSIGNGGQTKGVNNQNGSLSTVNVDASQQQQQHTTASDVKSPDKVKSDPDNSPSQNKKQQQEQLFHDHSSDLHESSSWNIMCSTLSRIVPPSNLLLSTTQNASATYKHILRKHVSDEYALISEIHEGKYDTNHIGCTVGQNDGDVGLYASDLRLPTLVGYVASIQCHAHSDWTALLVDEMQSVGGGGSSNNDKGGGTNGIGKGVMCWVEEKLVKQHGGWVRPGVVWMIEGAKLALFNSTCEEDDVEEDDDDDTGVHGNSLGTDISPSTGHARGGGNINRMILVGESSLVYAWTPEEAAPTFSHDEFISLTEKRLNLGLPEVIDNVIDVDKGHDVKTALKPAVDQNPSLAKVNVTSSKPSDVIDIDNDDKIIAGKKKSEDVNKMLGISSTAKSQTPRSVSSVRKAAYPKAAVDSLGSEDIIEILSPNQHTADTQSEMTIPQVTAATLTEQVTQHIQHSPTKERGVVVLETEEGEGRPHNPDTVAIKEDESSSALKVDHPSHDTAASSNKVNANKVESKSKVVESPCNAQSVKKTNTKTSDNDPLGLSKFKATAKPPPSQHATSNQVVSTTHTHDKSVHQQAKATINPYAKENSKANGTSISNELQRPVQSTETPEDNKSKTDKNEPLVNKPESDKNDLYNLLELTPPRQVPPDQARKDTSSQPNLPVEESGQVPFSESASSDKGPSTNNVKSNDSFDVSEDMVAAKVSHLTPKEQIKRQSPKNRLNTGDSFDDMLNEDDDEDMFVDLATGTTLDKSDVNLTKAAVPFVKANESNTSNPVVASTVQAPSTSPFALSSLDDEDLDMLDED